MRAVASHAVQPDSSAGKHQKAPGPFPMPVAPVSVTHREGALLQRKANCACGGGCPGCAEEVTTKTIQTKLRVGAAGDEYEQEADRVADQIMRMPDPMVQRQCTSCADTSIQRSNDEEVPIQRHASGGAGAGDVPADFTNRLGTGAPLDSASRSFFEERFDHDFSHVRIHNDAQAAAAASSVHARAFTLGHDVVFAPGEHNPGHESGRHLLAHELTHVIQQSGGAKRTGAGEIQTVAPITRSRSKVQRVCGSAAIGNPAGCEPFGSVATEQIFSVPTERFLFTVNCNDFASAAELTRLRTLAPTIPAADPVDIHGFASEEGDVTYNARLSCSRAMRVRDELINARTRAGLPALNIRDIYNHGATAFGTRDIDRSVVIPLARPPTVEILPAGFIGPPAANQRRAAASCSIDCGDQNIGTMHAMALFFHRSRGPILPNGDPTADGIGTSLHFTETAIEIPDTDACHCDDYGIIQAVDRTHPPAGRANPGIDNAGQNTPFYNEVFRSGEGIHEIPGGYPDAGERVQSTISIYDRPFIRSARWEAEACVACIKNGAPDRIFGCVTYGFTKALTDAPGDDEQVTGIGPGCRAAPSATFLTALRTDPTVSAYDFEGR